MVYLASAGSKAGDVAGPLWEQNWGHAGGIAKATGNVARVYWGRSWSIMGM